MTLTKEIKPPTRADNGSTFNCEASEPRVGDRVRLIHMHDPYGPETGDEGTVAYIGDVRAADIEGSPELKHLMGRKKYWVKWDSGGTMAMIEGVDRYEIAQKE